MNNGLAMLSAVSIIIIIFIYASLICLLLTCDLKNVASRAIITDVRLSFEKKSLPKGT